VTDVPRLPTRPPAKNLHSAPRVKERADAMRACYLRDRNGRLGKGGEEPAAGLDNGRQLREAQLNLPLAEGSKQRLRDAEVGLFRKLLEFKRIGDHKFRMPELKHVGVNFLRLSSLDHLSVLVDSEIVSGHQVRNQQPASA